MKKIITYGSFDRKHRGHTNLFKKMREIVGDTGEVWVAVSTSGFNRLKGKCAHDPFSTRISNVESDPSVTGVLAECSWEQKEKDIMIGAFDFFIIGMDWAGQFDDLPCTVLYTPRTPGISSTQLRRELEKNENKS